MSESQNYAKRRCEAMADANIIDPDSGSGIEFCVGKCPYEHCVAFEQVEGSNARRARGRRNFAKALRAHSVSVEDIALILSTSARTVQRYLKQ